MPAEKHDIIMVFFFPIYHNMMYNYGVYEEYFVLWRERIMKKKISLALSVLLVFSCLVVGEVLLPTRSFASEITYTGTVSDKTTTDVLYLSTSGGVVEIKLDATTEFSNAKFLLPGNQVTANCYTGSDEYWHASKISGSTSAGRVNVDKANSSKVKGTVAKGTSEELLYLVVSNGTMQIKIDEDTDVSGVGFLIIGKTIEVTCARGSDAYMHALSISDVAGRTISSSSGKISGTGVTGKVEKGTTSSILYLETSGGTMQFVLDLATDASACRVLIPGQSVTVSYYRGNDAWNHASKMINNTSNAASVVALDEKSRMTVSGKVTEDSTENTLHLNTSGGEMHIRLDENTDYSRCPVLLFDKTVQVVCEVGSDEYFHAVQVISK